MIKSVVVSKLMDRYRVIVICPVWIQKDKGVSIVVQICGKPYLRLIGSLFHIIKPAGQHMIHRLCKLRVYLLQIRTDGRENIILVYCDLGIVYLLIFCPFFCKVFPDIRKDRNHFLSYFPE